MMFYNVSLMVYRDTANGVREILVGYNAFAEEREFYLPSHSLDAERELDPEEELIPSVRQFSLQALGIDIPESALSLEASVTMHTDDTPQRNVRVFLVGSTEEFEALTQRYEFRGLRFTFMPASAMQNLWVTPNIVVPREGVILTLDRTLEILEE
ncbi:hypothetical protein F5B22DRAFT_657482 [Xylaria bambusicola]|uniref:uncharacterized protein n=1 Tax=Xylaria bambusicola TaxID=326684 RepID=UPI0020076113|nr:uncharacterized protein F5B22DRAFT_657482 [Xylaria bambusicola]KAI0513075.1 hypothetical protein F5B22DRAFT_657482 [Xylaria bambusicola]